MKLPIAFQNRFLPAKTVGGFKMDNYWIWCGSVVKREDNRFHMFASRWPKRYPFYHGYLASTGVPDAAWASLG
jgi:hypothetical protein